MTVTDRIHSRGGSLANGGFVELSAGEDVNVSAVLNVDGGDFDGGLVEVTAGRDANIAVHVRANSRAGAGYGGEIRPTAGRDLNVGGAPDTPSSSRTRM